MTEFERKRDQMIEHLEYALALVDELHDSLIGHLIERALDEARAGNFRSGSRENSPQQRRSRSSGPCGGAGGPRCADESGRR
jgi:hypothetical protein